MLANFFGENNSTIYYLFSTVAQVWAALVAFGGIGIRDRIISADKSMDEAFKVLVDKIRWISHPLDIRYYDNIFLNRENLAEWLENRGDFQKEARILSDNPFNEYFYLTPDGYDQKIEPSEYVAFIGQIQTYFNGYKAEKAMKEILKGDLKKLVLGGLVLIHICVASIIFAEPLSKCIPVLVLIFFGVLTYSSLLCWHIYKSFLI